MSVQLTLDHLKARHVAIKKEKVDAVPMKGETTARDAEAVAAKVPPRKRKRANASSTEPPKQVKTDSAKSENSSDLESSTSPPKQETAATSFENLVALPHSSTKEYKDILNQLNYRLKRAPDTIKDQWKAFSKDDPNRLTFVQEVIKVGKNAWDTASFTRFNKCGRVTDKEACMRGCRL